MPLLFADVDYVNYYLLQIVAENDAVVAVDDGNTELHR